MMKDLIPAQWVLVMISMSLQLEQEIVGDACRRVPAVRVGNRLVLERAVLGGDLTAQKPVMLDVVDHFQEADGDE